MSLNQQIFTPTSRKQLAQSYREAKPYPHIVLEPLADDQLMHNVREELRKLPTTYKEVHPSDPFRSFWAQIEALCGDDTDLFKVYQSVDFKNIDENLQNQPQLKEELKHVLKLRDHLYSDEFRRFVSDITACGPLTSKTDMAANAYTRGCHLLTHDDVIGTRKISYIIYLTDPLRNGKWEEQDGGSLELYDAITYDTTEEKRDNNNNNNSNNNSNAAKKRKLSNAKSITVPANTPSARVLPLFNRMAMFKVDPGVSFHSVQEVYAADKTRITIQGWFHAAEAPEGFETIATLAQIKHLKEKFGDASFITREISPPFAESKDDEIHIKKETLQELAALGVNRLYLHPDTIESIASQFAHQGSIQLPDFLSNSGSSSSDSAAKQCNVNEWLDAVDTADDLGGGVCPRGDDVGVCDGCWRLVGPPHMKRHLVVEESGAEAMLAAAAATPPSAAAAASPPHAALAVELAAIRDNLFKSEAFAVYCAAVAAVATRVSGGFAAQRSFARRFRPGLDYTVATAPDAEKAFIDAALCFVNEYDNNTTNESEKGAAEGGGGGGGSGTSSSKQAAKGEKKEGEEEEEEEEESVWDSGVVGGYETYIRAEEETNAEVLAVYSAPTEHDDGSGGGTGGGGADENELLTVSAASNSLSIVLRPPQTMKFVQFVSAAAPSSRVDVVTEFQLKQ